MTPQEQEIAISELEDRVDRLRNIYEQYFLGFERLEPTVPRKDVERRMMLLRKEQIRNTAMRYRFNVITQKLNTYAMHWVRICRQIEEGTYKRHINRAKARFGEGSRAVDRTKNDPSIEVSFDEYTGDDLESVLNAAADAATATDTIPPSVRPPPAPAPSPQPPASAPAALAAARQPDRTARPVVLPVGGKPRVVLRRRDDDTGSQPAFLVAPRAAQTPPAAPAAPPPPAAAPAPSSPRLPVPSSPHFLTGPGSPRPAGPRIAPTAGSSGAMKASFPATGSAARVPAAPPAVAPKPPGSPLAGPPSERDRDTGPASSPGPAPAPKRPAPPLPSQTKK